MGQPLGGEEIRSFQADFERTEKLLCETIVGQERLVRDLLTAFVAGGHVLLEGLPGLGKTHLAKALARATGGGLARVQCTPDLLPADITGSEILVRGEGDAEGELRFRPGPIFASQVLVDEINRATPRTQSALLEAMQEGQVSYGGQAYPLPRPFWVVATQNPIELEGTYPLPEAQLDRFFFKCKVPEPCDEALLRIVDVSLDDEPADRLEPVVSRQRVQEMMAQAREIVIPDAIKRDAVALVLATRPGKRGVSSHESAHISRANAHISRGNAHIRYGASPRALQTLLRAARVRALAAGRGHVAIEDVADIALPTLRHRVLLTIESEVEGVEVDALLEEVVRKWARDR